MWTLYHSKADIVILLVVFAASVVLAGKPSRAGPRAKDILDRLGSRTGLCFLLVGIIVLVGRAAVSLGWRFPQPRLHDEFSYLLAADTYAHGRLANPAHRPWQPFESFHILQQPTYASRYPPAQGLVMAAGKRVGGHPIVGVWLSAVLGCLALYWMLLAWLPPTWAPFGTLIAALRFGIAGYWTQSYFGGWMAVLGGALLFGGVRRILERTQVADPVLAGVGLAILANSRPFEGAIVGLCCGAVLVVWLVRQIRRGRWSRGVRGIVPLGVVLVLNLVGMAFFNRAVTGDPLKHPHQLYAETYMSVPYFLFLSPPPPPTYRHVEMATLHKRWERQLYDRQHTLEGWLELKGQMLSSMWRFYLGAALTLPLLWLPVARRDPWVIFAILACLLYLGINLTLMPPSFPHYAAPLTGPLVFLIAQGARSASDSARWHWFGTHLRRGCPSSAWLRCSGPYGIPTTHGRPRIRNGFRAELRSSSSSSLGVVST